MSENDNSEISVSDLQSEINEIGEQVYNLNTKLQAVINKAKKKYEEFDEGLVSLGTNTADIARSNELISEISTRLNSLEQEGRTAILELTTLKARLDGGRIDDESKEASLEVVRQDTRLAKRFLFGSDEQQGIGTQSAVELFEELSRYKFSEFFRDQLPGLIKLRDEYESEKTAAAARKEKEDEENKKKARNNEVLRWAIGLTATSVIGFIYRNTFGDLQAQIDSFTSQDYVYLETFTGEFSKLDTRIDDLESFKDVNTDKLDAIGVTVRLPE